MNDQELEALLSEIESDRVERKSAISDRDKIRQAICAFANDLPGHQEPGVIFVGVDDQGNCANLPIADELLRKLADMRQDVLPFASMRVQKRTLRGCDVVVVIVDPSEDPPVRYDGRIWVRVGPRRALATPDEERRLAEKRRSRDLPFDIRPAHRATLDDLDVRLFQWDYLRSTLPVEVLEQNERSVEQQLASLRFATPDIPPIPTNLGILVVGLHPRTFLPGAYIQFLRIDGLELTDPIKDQKEISGSLIEILRILDDVLQSHISVASDIATQPTELRVADYPLSALQQLARNAVLHRNYEDTNAPVRLYWFQDHIEISNPGGPFGSVNQRNFGQPGITDYRNPHLAEAMKNLGYVQRFGMGIALARKELARNGNPPPEFATEEEYVTVTIRSREGARNERTGPDVFQ
jgi:ATP-dependent DNA helicase RecG